MLSECKNGIILKPLEESKRKKLLTADFGKNFLDMTSKVQGTKEKNKAALHQSKKLFTATINKMKQQLTE